MKTMKEVLTDLLRPASTLAKDYKRFTFRSSSEFEYASEEVENAFP
jgi:hypothetical protein